MSPKGRRAANRTSPSGPGLFFFVPSSCLGGLSFFFCDEFAPPRSPSSGFAPHSSEIGLYFSVGFSYMAVMVASRPFSNALERLRGVGLRPTRQRLALARLLFDRGHRHVSAEQLHGEALASDVRVSLATVYNTLHQFTTAGLLAEVVVESGCSYFDTNVEDHHHFFFEDTGMLQDIPGDRVLVNCLPPPPDGMAVRRVDVIIRVGAAKYA